MNCKPGELAFVVRGFPGGSLKPGMVVTCLDFVPEMRSAIDNRIYRGVWLVDHNGNRLGACGNPLGTLDECLRPIRPGDMQDEVIDSKELEAA